MATASVSSPSILFRLEHALVETLQERLPDLKWLAKSDQPTAEPPYGAVQCDEARETVPESGVYFVKTLVLVAHLLGEESGKEHHRVAAAARAALEMLPLPCADEGWEVRVYGLTIDRVLTADTDQEQGTMYEITCGCGVLEKQEGGPVNTPNSET